MVNQDFMVFYWIGTGVFFVCVMAFLIRKIYIMKHSEYTRKRATKVFRLHGGIRGWKTFENVILGEGGDGVAADQLVIGPFGIIVACDLHQKGSIYGELDAKEWIVSVGEEGRETKTRIPSPYHQAQLCVEQLRSLLAKNKVYSVPVEILVPKTQKQGCYITGSGQHLLGTKELKAQLEKTRFEKDNGVNVELIAALFDR